MALRLRQIPRGVLRPDQFLEFTAKPRKNPLLDPLRLSRQPLIGPPDLYHNNTYIIIIVISKRRTYDFKGIIQKRKMALNRSIRLLPKKRGCTTAELRQRIEPGECPRRFLLFLVTLRDMSYYLKSYLAYKRDCSSL